MHYNTIVFLSVLFPLQKLYIVGKLEFDKGIYQRGQIFKIFYHTSENGTNILPHSGAASSEDGFSALMPNKSASKPLMDEMGKVSGSLCGNLQDQVCFGADARDKALHMEYSHVIGCKEMEPTNGKQT